MEPIQFTPYLKENIYRQIRERVKRRIPFEAGEIGTVVGSTLYHPDNTLSIQELKQRLQYERERPQREEKEREAEERKLMKQEDKLSKENERNLEIENKIMAKATRHSEKLRLEKEIQERKLMRREDKLAKEIRSEENKEQKQKQKQKQKPNEKFLARLEREAQERKLMKLEDNPVFEKPYISFTERAKKILDEIGED